MNKPNSLFDLDHLKNFYKKNGYFSPLEYVSSNEASQVRRRIESIEKGKRLSGLIRLKPHLLLGFLWDIVHDNRILNLVEHIIGPNIYCIGSSIIDKIPESQHYVAYHQDATFWGLSQPKGVTVWVALTSSNEKNGGMYVAPGTHFKQLRHFDTKDSLNMLGAGESVENIPNHSQLKPLILSPGQMSFHHPLILHGSPSNQTQERRLAFVIRYIPAYVSQKGATVTLAQGNNLSAMELESPPLKDLSATLLQTHSEIIRKNAKVIRTAKNAYFKSINKRDNELSCR